MSGPRRAPSAHLAADLRAAGGLLFVCSGNMLRSAFAELYARHRGLALPARSVATTYRNPGLHAEARRALLARGVDPAAIAGFRPTHVEDAPPRPGELAFGMTREHLEALSAWPALAGRAHLLRALEGSGEELADPFHDGRYAERFAAIARCVDVLVATVDGD